MAPTVPSQDVAGQNEAGDPPFLLPGEVRLAEGRASERYAVATAAVGQWYILLTAAMLYALLQGAAFGLPKDGFWSEVHAFIASRGDEYLALGAAAIAYTWTAGRRWLRLRQARYLVTNRHIYAWRATRFGVRVTTMPADRATDVEARQSFGERLGGGWTVTVGCDGGEVTMQGVQSPQAMREHLATVCPLLAATPASHRTAGPTTSRLLWEGRPSRTSILVPVVGSPTIYVASVLVIAPTHILGPLGLSAWANLARLVAALTAFTIVTGSLALARASYEVREDRVVRKHGLLARTEQEVYAGSIADVSITRTVWGRVLGYGSVRIASTSGDSVSFTGTRDVDTLRSLVERVRAGGGTT